MLPALQVTCECSQCRNYAHSVLYHASVVGKTYSDISPVWASEPFCSGSCGTHSECDHCSDCDLPSCDCQCEKCEHCECLTSDCECNICDDCGKYLEYYECHYCSECDGPTCSCDCSSSYGSEGRFGSIKVAPWVDRGIVVNRVRVDDGDTVRAMWGIDASIDVCQSAADFYLLKGLAAGVVNPLGDMSKSDTLSQVLRAEAETLLSALTDRLDRTFRGYVDMVVGGELRHHRAASTSTLKNTGRSEAWGEWHAIREAAGVSALSDAETLFVDFHSNSYGGEAWARIARTLRERLQGKRTASQFVDNVFSLEHNGGCLFDKSSWAVRNPMQWHYGSLGQYILPAHGATNPWPILLLVASDEVRELFYATWQQGNILRRSLGQRANRFPVSPRPRKGYYGERYLDHNDILPGMLKSGTWS